MSKIIAAERRKRIAEILMEQGSIKIGKTAELFQVSTETIRKDLIYLNQIGFLEKKHGGAVIPIEFMAKPIESRFSENIHLKNAIARKAMEFVSKEDMIFIDGGSTTLCLAKLLSLKSGFTIITTSLNIINALENSKNTVYLAGGQLNQATKIFEGFGTVDFLRKLKISTSFLGCSGIQDQNGPAVSEFGDAEVKQIVVENSKKNIVLADSTKIAYSSLVAYTNWKSIDFLITDEFFPDDFSFQSQSLSNFVSILKSSISEN